MKNKLNGRDFITIGIFNAIGIVIYMAVAFAMATTVIVQELFIWEQWRRWRESLPSCNRKISFL